VGFERMRSVRFNLFTIYTVRALRQEIIRECFTYSVLLQADSQQCSRLFELDV
jgi:hypothetical protein